MSFVSWFPAGSSDGVAPVSQRGIFSRSLTTFLISQRPREDPCCSLARHRDRDTTLIAAILSTGDLILLEDYSYRGGCKRGPREDEIAILGVYGDEGCSRRTRWRWFHPQDGDDSWKLIRKDTRYNECPFESTKKKRVPGEHNGEDFIHKMETIFGN